MYDIGVYLSLIQFEQLKPCWKRTRIVIGVQLLSTAREEPPAMSVFQLQEWWGVKLADNEEFDHGCMVVGNIDNAEPATEKIAVGSLQGMLRIYSPTRPQFRVEDLILEESLGAPILQLLLGRFIPASNMLGLAVLHPKKLVVFELLPQSKSVHTPNFFYYTDISCLLHR